MTRVVAAAFFIAASFVALRTYIEIDRRRFGLRCLSSAGVGVSAAIPAAVFRFTEHDSMNLLELLIVIAACGLLWLLGIFVTRHFVWGELLIVARRAVGH